MLVVNQRLQGLSEPYRIVKRLGQARAAKLAQKPISWPKHAHKPAGRLAQPVYASQRPQALVTGGSSGIGLEVVASLLAQGYDVSAVASSHRSAMNLQQTLFQRQLPPIQQVYIANVMYMSQAEQLASLLVDRHAQLDVLIHSLGVFVPKRNLTNELIEQNLAVNALAPWYLTQQLLPSLQRSPQGKIISVSSEAHRGTLLKPMRLDWQNLQGERAYTFLDQYATSKFVQLALMEHLRVSGTLGAVKLYHVHPGLVRTKLGRAFPDSLTWAHNLIACSSQQGAKPVLSLVAAAGNQPEGYYNRFRLQKPAALCLQASIQQELFHWAQLQLERVKSSQAPLDSIERC